MAYIRHNDRVLFAATTGARRANACASAGSIGEPYQVTREIRVDHVLPLIAAAAE